LFEALEGVRDRRYAIDDGERLEGLRCIAAPIKGRLSERVLSAANVVELNINYGISFRVSEQV